VPFCPEALFDRRAAADDEKPAEDTPIGRRQIIKGLAARASKPDRQGCFLARFGLIGRMALA
jgi:hypothetical protein